MTKSNLTYQEALDLYIKLFKENKNATIFYITMEKKDGKWELEWHN